MNQIIPDYLYSFNAVTGVFVLISVLALISFGSARIKAGLRERLITAGLLSGALLAWFVLAEILGEKNVYRSGSYSALPTLQYGLLIPIILGLVLLIRSARIARLIDALPLSWLVAVQFYRVLGFVFLLLWWQGQLPWQFALPAGIGDVATGLLALVVAGWTMRKAQRTPHVTAPNVTAPNVTAPNVTAPNVTALDTIPFKATYAWCLFGIADLVIAVTMGTISSQGPLQIVAIEAPNMLISAYPLVMIPTFAVPLAIILHVLCLWKLRRLRAEIGTKQQAETNLEMRAT